VAVLSVRFWGTRGSIPTPGPTTARYGGNTSCVEVRAGNQVLMIDCGTGAREMGLALLREYKGAPIELHVFVSHTHWDHIQGFPFFVPAYQPGNDLTFYSLRGADKSLDKIFTGQMDSNYFPVDLRDMRANLQFVELDGPVRLGEVEVSHTYLNHPGLAIGFRVQHKDKSLVYIADHEPYHRLLGDTPHNRRLEGEITEFGRGADLYIRDSQYTEEEYAEKRGWGHSPWPEVLDSAHAGKVKQLALYHHDPMHDDVALERILTACRERMQRCGMTFNCFLAAEGLEVIL
jgi:phosphoribosyl 1,2-cyclic phosphodiesterase